MFLDILLILAVFYLSIPALAGYFAASYGKSFWFWFFYGLIFPVIAHFHLLLYISFEERRVQKQFHMSLQEERHMDQLIKSTIREIGGEPEKTEQPYHHSYYFIYRIFKKKLVD
ncbi:MAG: hypothetical protein ACNS62_23535 [Candidatus Cyclobacteriaceae bacterium M3_2C_046]